MRWSVWFVAAAWLPALVGQELQLAAPFQSRMVLQRGRELRITGQDLPGTRIRIELAAVHGEATVAADGRFEVVLPALAAGGPHRLDVRGSSTVQLDDVLVGEVWIASGQSNMHWSLSQVGAEDAIATAADPELRLLQLPRRASAEPLSDLGGATWLGADRATAGDFSAVAYYFARELRARLRVPVGIVQVSWGGTYAEAWTRAAALPESMRAEPPAKEERHRPGQLWNGMLAPLLPLPVRGVIWYQGESNTGRATQYRTLFPLLIRDWRAAFGQPELPFLFVQLANFRSRRSSEDWPELREAQRQTLALPVTGMAVAIDIGDPDDIHPKNKLDVGRRLALQARKLVYGEAGLVADGPVLAGAARADAAARLRFGSIGDGLVALGGELRGFELAGADGVFHAAQARIDGDSVVVIAAAVAVPQQVRYAWAADPDATLYNSAGLPASPFRALLGD